jgi:hypothetical protein
MLAAGQIIELVAEVSILPTNQAVAGERRQCEVNKNRVFAQEGSARNESLGHGKEITNDEL